jgi:hypothetical protein
MTSGFRIFKLPNWLAFPFSFASQEKTFVIYSNGLFLTLQQLLERYENFSLELF